MLFVISKQIVDILLPQVQHTHRSTDVSKACVKTELLFHVPLLRIDVGEACDALTGGACIKDEYDFATRGFCTCMCTNICRCVYP